MELTREVLEDMAECDNRSCTCCKGGCEDWAHGISSLARLLLAEMDKPKVWDGAPEWATIGRACWTDKKHGEAWSTIYRRELPKTRVDEIAEEAVDKYQRGAVGAGSLKDIIKSAILKDREEWEVNQ